MRNSLKQFFFLLLLLFLPYNIYAARKRPCMADKKKFCQSVSKGKGAIRKCLRQNIENLSANCKKRFLKKEARKKACKGFVDSLCSDHKGNRKAVRKCMLQNKDKLSDECKKMISKRSRRKE